MSVTGSAPFTYSASYPSGSFIGAAGPLVSFPSASTSFGGVFNITATNAVGASAVQSFFVRVIPSAPFIVTQPTAVQTNSGRPVNLTVAVGGSSGFSYQWFKNGSAVTSGNVTNTSSGSSLTFGSPNPADSGDFTVVHPQQPWLRHQPDVHLGVDETPRFVNIATRALAGRTDSPLIAGFVVAGPGTKRVMVRAVGPTLGSAFNLPAFSSIPSFPSTTRRARSFTPTTIGPPLTMSPALPPPAPASVPSLSRPRLPMLAASSPSAPAVTLRSSPARTTPPASPSSRSTRTTSSPAVSSISRPAPSSAPAARSPFPGLSSVAAPWRRNSSCAPSARDSPRSASPECSPIPVSPSPTPAASP